GAGEIQRLIGDGVATAVEGDRVERDRPEVVQARRLRGTGREEEIDGIADDGRVWDGAADPVGAVAPAGVGAQAAPGELRGGRTVLKALQPGPAPGGGRRAARGGTGARAEPAHGCNPSRGR